MMFLTSVAVAAALAVAVLPATSAPFGGELWKKRIVLIFSSPSSNPAADQSSRLLSAQDDLRERDLLVVRIEGHETAVLFGTASDRLHADALRSAYQIGPDEPFVFVLVGKDGGEKLRRKNVIQPQELFDIIDAMPMRRNEANKT